MKTKKKSVQNHNLLTITVVEKQAFLKILKALSSKITKATEVLPSTEGGYFFEIFVIGDKIEKKIRYYKNEYGKIFLSFHYYVISRGEYEPDEVLEFLNFSEIYSSSNLIKQKLK